MMTDDFYILHNDKCELCVWCENGFYNPICAHCKFVHYGKSKNEHFMTRSMAEGLELVKPKEKQNDDDNGRV